MVAEIVNLRPSPAQAKRRAAATRKQATQYPRQDWEAIEDHLWRASVELRRAVDLFYASRHDK